MYCYIMIYIMRIEKLGDCMVMMVLGINKRLDLNILGCNNVSYIQGPI